MIDTAAVSRYADRIMAMIREDAERPFARGKQVPRDVASFTALHDYLERRSCSRQAAS